MGYDTELAKFDVYLRAHSSLGTTRVYMHALNQWFRLLGEIKPTQLSAQAYIDTLEKSGLAPSTIGTRAHAIVRYFRWKGEAITIDSPTIRFGEPEYLILDQINELVGTCNTVLEETLIVVLFDTAVRINELLNLELDDIDWARGFISVIRKGGRRQEVNIAEKALVALREWLDVRKSTSKRVFMDITYYDAWLTLKNVGKRAGIDVHPHIFRHSRAIHMLMNGADMRTVSDHLGHSNITVTFNVYGRFKAVHLKELVPAW